MTTGINNSLSIVVCEDANAAIARGYNYGAWVNKPVALNISKAVVVRKGTVGGNSTADLILTDDKGQQYVTMITGNLLCSLARVCDNA